MDCKRHYTARARFLGGNPIGKRVVVLAGNGGNGGGAMVCARRLHNWGADVRIFLTKPVSGWSGVPAQQLDILQRMGAPVMQADAIADEADTNLIVDGLIGYGLSGPPRGDAAALIRWANAQPAPILALDTPSGLDTTTGLAYDPTIHAAATMTLALPKSGLLHTDAEHYVGELYLADIGVPPGLYASAALNLHVGPIFAQDDIVRLC